MKLEQGLQVVGLLHGYLAEPWSSNGKTGTNHILAVSRQYTDKFGQLKEETFQIGMAADVILIKHVSECVKKNEGKLVSVPVVATIRTGKDGKSPWLSYFMPKLAQIHVLGE